MALTKVKSRVLSLLEPSFSTNPHNVLSDRVVIAMVGLPARGKSYISKAIVRYLNFLGCPTRLFNAGNKRRTEGAAGASAAFFDAKNLDAAAQRERIAMETLDELLEWLHGQTLPEAGCACGILDATNTTRARREKVRRRIAREQPTVRLLFVESICNDEVVLENNYRLKLSNDDYKGQDPEAAYRDFVERVRQYELVYEPVDDEIECRPFEAAEIAAASSENGSPFPPASPKSPGSEGGKPALSRGSSAGDAPPPTPGCLKLIDAGRRLVTNSCSGPVGYQLLNLLHSVHLGPRCIWITLVGETANDIREVYGGDSPLSRDGQAYAHAVRSHILAREASEELRLEGEPPTPAMVLTGTLRRYAQFAELLCEPPEASDRTVHAGTPPPRAQRLPQRRQLQLQRLNELCAGKLDSLTYQQMQELYPREYAARAADKLHYRYPGAGGESYMDLIMRLDSIILMLEQTRGNALVVCDRAVCRVLLGYFEAAHKGGGAPDLDALPQMEVQPGIIELRRSHAGFTRTHTPIAAGATTRVAGPGTNPKLPGQRANRLEKALAIDTPLEEHQAEAESPAAARGHTPGNTPVAALSLASSRCVSEDITDSANGERASA